MNSEWLWNRLARKWDTPGVNLGENDLRIVEKARKYLKTSDVVLDYGCATGSIALEIASTVRESRGIDASSKMIEIARRKADERKIENANFNRATIFDERLEAESYDLILALNILHLLENSQPVISRINQLLKPGGFFISATPCLGEKKLASLLINIPVFCLSKTRILPHVNFFSAPGLIDSISHEDFQIIETESLSLRVINQILVTARKK